MESARSFQMDARSGLSKLWPVSSHGVAVREKRSKHCFLHSGLTPRRTWPTSAGRIPARPRRWTYPPASKSRFRRTIVESYSKTRHSCLSRSLQHCPSHGDSCAFIRPIACEAKRNTRTPRDLIRLEGCQLPAEYNQERPTTHCITTAIA